MSDLLTNLEKENENEIIDSAKNEYLSIK